MLLGSAFSGLAIENSMLGAAHASANPLTARQGLAHGHAVALMLPHVMRYNDEDPAARAVYEQYGNLLSQRGYATLPVVEWVERLISLAALPALAEAGVDRRDFPVLAEDATRQWTGQFNPRAMTEASFVLLYEAAMDVSSTSRAK